MRAALLSTLVAAACVGVLWLRFNAPPPERGLLYPHDLLYSYYPKLDAIGSRLARFDLPLWNPDGCAGIPLLGSIQNAILYPPIWLSGALPADLVLTGLSLLHLLIAGIGAALLFRNWRAPPVLAGALAGVFVFVCVLGQSFWLTQIFAIAWLPWILLCIERSLNEPHAWRWWAGLVAVTALQLLAGFPQHVVYTLQLAVPWTLVRVALSARDHRGIRWAEATRAAGSVALALGLGAGIAGAQLVPAAELIFESERSERVTPSEVHYLQSQPRLQTLLANAVDASPRNTAFEIGRGAGYVGAGTLVLAAAALVLLRRQPLAWTLALIGAVALALSDGYLGFARPLFDVYSSLPLVGSFRSPERLLLLAGFSVVALAALGSAALAQAEPRTRAAAAATAALAATSIVWQGNTQAGLVAAGAAGLLTGSLFLPRNHFARPLLEWSLAALLIADVGLATGAYGSLRDFPSGWAEAMHVGGRRLMSDEDFAAQQRRIGDGRVSFHGKGIQVRPIAGAGPLRGAKRLGCYETPVPRGWQQLARRVDGGDYRSAVAANIDPNRFGAFLDLAGVVETNEVQGNARQLARPRFAEYAAPVETPPGAADEVSLVIRPNRDVLPRAYLVGSYEVATQEGGLERLADGNFDYRNRVLLDREPALQEPRIDGLQSADILAYEAERVEITTNAPAAALLVLSDSYYPGWRVRVDDVPAEILRANGLFRAVVVPAGEHRVVFEYVPTSLRVGAGISAMAFIAAALVCLRTRSRQRGTVAS